MKRMVIVLFSLFAGGIVFSQPIVSITAPTNVTSTGFTLNGVVSNNNGNTTGTVSRFLISQAANSVTDSSGTIPGSNASKITTNNVTVYQDFPNNGVSTVLPNTIYYYKIGAKNNAGYTRSTESFFRTLPSNPTGLTVSGTSITDSSLTLNWSNTGSQYRLLMKTTGNSTTTSDGTILYNGSNTTYLVSGLDPNTTYYFTLYARSSDVTPVFSSASLSVSATTLNSSLPVEMVSFTYSIEGNTIKLNWETKTEIGNYGWEIENGQWTTDNGQRKNTEFKRIGFVAGKGTTTERQNYTFSSRISNHASPEFFRLKQIDQDGKFSYSNTLTINPLPETYSLSQNYPNPFNPKTVISYQVSAAGRVELKVFDLLGKEVQTLVNRNLEAGNYSVDFDATNLPSGIYFYKLTAGRFSEMKKMMVIK